MNFFTFKKLGQALMLSAVVILGVVSVGYGQGASSLAGIWVPDGGGTAPRGFPDQMELMSDGTCIFEGNSASWKTSGERLYFMNIGGSSGIAYNYKNSDSELVLINDQGYGAKYRKHKPGDKPLPTKEEQEAITLFNNVNAMMQQDAKREEQFINQGEAYHNNGMYDKAIEAYSEAIKINPKSLIGYLMRGKSYSAKKDHDRAINDYTKGLNLAPNTKVQTMALNSRGYAYLGKRDYDKALADFNKAVQLSPNEANPYDSRGEAYLTIGDYDKAIEDYSKALRLDPTMESAKKGLAEAKKKKQGR